MPTVASLPLISKNESPKHFCPATLKLCPCAFSETSSHLPSISLKFDPPRLAWFTAPFTMPAKFTSSFLKVNTISPLSVPCLYSSESLFSRSSPPPSEYLPPPRLFRAKFCSAFSHELPPALLRLRRALSPLASIKESSSHFCPAVLNVCPCAVTEIMLHLPSSSLALKFDPKQSAARIAKNLNLAIFFLS